MSKFEKKANKNIEGLTMVMESIIVDSRLREEFLEDSIGTLEDLGVKIENKEIAKSVSVKLQSIIKDEISKGRLVANVGNIVGGASVAVAATAVVTGVVTGVATGAATYGATKAASIVNEPDIYELLAKDIHLDFQRIRLIKDLREGQERIRVLEREVNISRREIR